MPGRAMRTRWLSVTEGGGEALLVSSSDASFESSPKTGGSLLVLGVSTYCGPHRVTIIMDLRVSIPRDVMLPMMTYSPNWFISPIPRLRRVMYGPAKIELSVKMLL